MIVTDNDIKFGSAHEALVFAFNVSTQAYDRPMMNRIGSPSVGSGNGLAGLEAAGQAGMIRAEIATLGRLAEALLVARLAPRWMPCHCRQSCCSGKKPNKEWTDAIAFLSDYVRNTALAGCTANGVMRREYVVRYFSRKDERTSIDALAERYDINRHTISAHAAKVAILLGGQQVKKDKSAVPGLESTAIDAIENQLREVGMVG